MWQKVRNKVTDNEFLLQDRLQKIRQIINKYGEENFYISFSGGKDSTVLSALVDMALPDNKIPRVYANTGIELNMVRDFVFDMAKTDDRVVIIKPEVSFHPLSVVTKDWEDWFIAEYHIEISDIYKKPYNRERTGCKGCPFALDLQEELDMLQKIFPE